MRATIIKIEKEYNRILLEKKDCDEEQCRSCALANSCNSSKESSIVIVPYKAGFKEGETVEWEIDGMQKIYLCVAFFLLPIMILLISYLFISTFITKSESVCAVISVGMFALTAIVVFVVHKKFYNPAKLHVMGE